MIDRIAVAVAGRAGKDALAAFAGAAYRAYALERPGRYAATQIRIDQSLIAGTHALHRTAEITYGMLRAYGLAEPDLTDAVRLLRATFHGFCALESAGGFGAPATYRSPGTGRSTPCTWHSRTGPRRRAPMTDPHYDITGHGPLLLLLPGGAGHPMGLGPMTEALAGHFRVVTYDHLGLAHGRLGEPVEDQRVQDWSDGARRVLDATLPEGGTAYVLGTSAGAIAALDLLARHAERLRHVVAHEPPCVGVLPDGARQQAAFREICEVYRTKGLAAAGALMTAVLEDRAVGSFRRANP